MDEMSLERRAKRGSDVDGRVATQNIVFPVILSLLL